MLVSRSNEALLYEKLSSQQKVLEEMLLDILLKKEQLRKKDVSVTKRI